MKIKFRTLFSFAIASLMGFGAWRTSHVRAAEPSSPAVEQAADGSVILGATDVKIDGPNARIEGGDTKRITWWTDVDTSLHWTAKIAKPGKYRVELNFAVLGNRTHAELSIAAGGQATEAVLIPGNGMDDFRWGQAGMVTINKAGEIPVTATSLSRNHECVIYLRSILLRPADTPSQAADISGSPIKAAEDGTFKLPAAVAGIDGINAVIESKAGEKDIGFWEGWETSVDWKIDVQKPGRYRVELNYSLVPDCEGTMVAVLVGGESVMARPKAGASWADFRQGQAGEVTITGTGYFPVVVKPVSKPGDYVMNLRSVTLAPADRPTTALDIRDKPVPQSSNGSIKLTAEEAEIDGQVARLEGGDEKYIVWRGNRDIGIAWPLIVDKPGRFNVTVTYSLGASGSSDVTLTAGGQSISGKLPPTHSWDNFETAKLGTLDLQDLGNLQVAMNSSMEPGVRIMNLRAVQFAPADK
jgi:predicted secreted protein